MTEFAYDVDVRLRDVDFMGHVNNAVYATYLEEAREAFFERIVGESLADLDTVLASLTIDYERPIHAGDEVVVSVTLSELGESSVPMAYEIRADGDLAATARTTQVFVDRETGRAASIPRDVRERLSTSID
ncbi:thioesterase family protein [Halovivax sp.]|uniref:acyl-CoA thioesterase n=1 Tax=Halovivax sp. TaxID=1935978 RepID=UPI0025B967CF|nr:thioesterase family protein [Halovivax sp.]